jgi:MFS family permease
MYFGVVGVGIGVQNYGTIIIKAINPKLTDVQLSLLFAPIWVMDGIAILLITPISDRFPRHRPHFFAASCVVIIVGLIITTFAPHPWPRYVGLLFVGFGLGPTVPICMTWTSEIFHRRHGEVGVAAATAFVSGMGNLGSVTTTYALFTGYPADKKNGYGFRNSNLIMVGILGVSIISSTIMQTILKWWDNVPNEDHLTIRDDSHSTKSDRSDGKSV